MNNASLSAFPLDLPSEKDIAQGQGKTYTGLSKREYFAGQILQGLAAKYNLKEPSDQQTITKIAVELSDELLRQLAIE